MKPLRVGVVGLGTVGLSTVKLLENNADILSQRSGRGFEIVAVSARNKNADRGIDTSKYQWFDTPSDMIDHIDVLVELIGGADGIAYDLVKQALSNGVSVVTANKALIAHHGYELAQLAESNDCNLMFEAAVAAAIPVVEAARQSLAANNSKAIYGILNGTCNYILTQMRETERDFAEVLKEAQEKGYAEADPSFDIDGVDAGHKIAVLSAVTFGVQPNFSAVNLQGITQVTLDDMKFASQFGYRIKLIAAAKREGDAVLQVVEPCFVPEGQPFAAIENAYNAIFFDCDYAETPLFTGLGAGGDATASAVVGDLLAVARDIRAPVFGVPVQNLKKAPQIDPREMVAKYYVRCEVEDKPGVMADVAAILRDHNISIERVLQDGQSNNGTVNLMIITHNALREDVNTAKKLIGRLDVVEKEPFIIRIEDDL